MENMWGANYKQDENNNDVCKIYLEDLQGDFPISREIGVAVLRFLYCLPIFETSGGGSHE